MSKLLQTCPLWGCQMLTLARNGFQLYECLPLFVVKMKVNTSNINIRFWLRIALGHGVVPRGCGRRGVEEAICKENKGLTDDIMKRDTSTFLRGVGRTSGRERWVFKYCAFGWLGNATHLELWERRGITQIHKMETQVRKTGKFVTHLKFQSTWHALN